MTSTQIRSAMLVGACGLAASVAACGSDSKSSSSTTRPATKPQPDVAARVVGGEQFLGLPLLREMGNRVRTDPAQFSADSPGFYTDPEGAVAALRRDGFVGGIIRTFKAPGRPDGASSSVVQMRDAAGAKKELERELAAARFPACPGGMTCTRSTREFDVAGVPGAIGVQTTVRIKGQVYSEHPDVLRSQVIVFRKGPFVYQLFLGADRPDARRAELVAAASKVAAQGTP